MHVSVIDQLSLCSIVAVTSNCPVMLYVCEYHATPDVSTTHPSHRSSDLIILYDCVWTVPDTAKGSNQLAGEKSTVHVGISR